NTDLSFSLVGTTLKENLVFSALPAETSYTYRLETTLRAEVQESGAVLFYADETPVIELAAPYLFDAAGEKSFDVSVTLSSVRDGYSYTVTPSRAWLADPARVYPVTLDPSFLEYNINNVKDNYAVTDLGGTSTATFNSIVSSLNASKSEIGAGRYTSTVKVGALIYADLLTQLQNDSPNARIVEARLHVAQTNTSCGVGRVVQAHKVTSDWNTATVSEDVVMAGDAAPTYESRVLDYYTTPSAVTEYSVLDITRAVQEWSTGHSENYGIYLDVADTDSTSSLVYWFSSDAINGPVFYVNYRDAMGVEDYWTYSSVSAGRYGTAAVNNFSGNLVSLQTVCATDGLRMPVELSLVYNSGVRTEAKFTKAGIGWKFNLELLLCTTEGDLAEDYPYYLLDADGTCHYFTKKSGTTEKWVDEDGLGLTLSYKRNSETNSISYFVLTAKDGTKTEFYYPGGRVYRILDPEDNYIQVNYSSNPIRISSVRDGANRHYNFTYNSADRVSKITDPAGREYTFTYSGTKLASITYPDSVKTEFSYYASTASAPNLLKTVKNPDATKLSVSYAGEFSQVSTFACLDSDGAQMSSLTFNYASPNRTVITDADNRKTEYQFNSFGQTVNVLAPAEGAARYYEYGASGGEKNKVTLSSKLQTPTVNFVTNHGFYPSLSGWTEETVGTTVAGESTYSTLKHLDARSLYIKKTDTGGATVIARKYTVGDLPAGAGYYTFSAYVKTEGLTAHATGGGAQLVLTYNDADGNRVSKRSASLTGTGADWTRLCVTQNIPSGASGIVLRLRILGADGIARFDSVQFEKGEVANRVNLLYNHSMEDVTDTVPTKWTTSETTSADYATVTQKYKGSRSYRITGAPGVNKNLQQSVYIQGSEGDSFVFGAFAKAASRKNTGISGRWASFSIVLEFYNGDDFLEQKKVDFNFGSTDWQKLSAVFVANHDYTRLTYYLTYYKNVNAVYFDATELYRETFGQSYKYDDNGNVVSTSDLAEKESTFEYSGANELVKQNNPTGTKYEYTYGSEHKHRLVSATAAGVTTTYSYGSFGNATKAKTKGNSDAYFEATSEYTSNGNYQTSSTDTLGNTTAYSYNTTKGTLTSVTDPKGNVTSYTYNASTNAPLTVTQGQSTVSYTYAADRLSTISTESSTYTFTYDEAGNTKQIKVGDRTLVTNTYDLSKGTLTRSAYGNGATVSYTYDSFDRVTREKHGSTTVAEYVYDNSGNLAILKDKLNGTETRYVYDLADRLVRMEDSAGLTVTYEYDGAGRQHKLSYTVGGETVTQEMTYGEGALADRPSGLVVNGAQIKSYTYDSLNRVTKTTLNTTAPVETNYTYLNHPTTANQTSSVVAGVKVGANAQYTYAYDQNGNIIRENKGGYTKYSYSYDEKGQLTGFSDADVYYDDA
ncbi:MAG: RHS repeat protein, partial [Clostridia bacterium]|nr:RHS repeat protein [Clostridia bacterium]